MPVQPQSSFSASFKFKVFHGYLLQFSSINQTKMLKQQLIVPYVLPTSPTLQFSCSMGNSGQVGRQMSGGIFTVIPPIESQAPASCHLPDSDPRSGDALLIHSTQIEYKSDINAFWSQAINLLKHSPPTLQGRSTSCRTGRQRSMKITLLTLSPERSLIISEIYLPCLNLLPLVPFGDRRWERNMYHLQYSSHTYIERNVSFYLISCNPASLLPTQHFLSHRVGLPPS